MRFGSHTSNQVQNNVVSCLGGEKTILESRAVPSPKTGEILLKLRMVGFCGTDLFKLTTNNVSKGMVLGHEIVGEVIKLGNGVTKFKVGDRVAVPHHVPCGVCALCQNGSETMCESFRDNLIAPGGFADHILIKNRATSHAAKRIPDLVSDETAVFLEPAACVLRGVNRSDLTSNGTAAIMGGGSMGLLHLLVIKAAYPRTRVLLIDPIADRCNFAKKLGADQISPPGDAAIKAANMMTNDYGIDAVFDTVGGSKVLSECIALSRKGGSVVLFAHAQEGAHADFILNDIFRFERRIIGTYSGALKEQSIVFELLTSGALNPSPLISHTLPLDEFATGYELAKERKALKILFTSSRAAGK